MNKEKLTCSKCNKNWQRISSRGRKPKFCPKCAADSTPVPVQKAPKTAQKAPKATKPASSDVVYPAPSKWTCKSCETKIEVCVGIKEAPIHKCPKRAMRVLGLELVG
jgi:hypothetical protein